MIAVDWGTSNFRAYRIDREGTIVARHSSAHGILRVQDGNFEAALRSEVGGWLTEGESRILLCGMAGSRQGWIEARYLPCPTGVADLANSVIAVPFSGADVRLICGVMSEDAAGVPEVMRGEETAAMGVEFRDDVVAGSGDSLLCFPGTHSKWLRMGAGRIAAFTTYMTGEMYSALRSHTILGRMMTRDNAVDQAAFGRGVARAAEPGGLLHHLFGVRTLGLMGQLSEEAAAGYLSGLLIGHEVRAAMPAATPATCQVHLVGARYLCELYALAIATCGGYAIIEDEDAVARGLMAIARRVQWT